MRALRLPIVLEDGTVAVVSHRFRFSFLPLGFVFIEGTLQHRGAARWIADLRAFRGKSPRGQSPNAENSPPTRSHSVSSSPHPNLKVGILN
jgi:hypothetical protein